MDVLTEQLNLEVSPLSVRCAHCGAETSFDLREQNYHCLFCGGVTERRQPRLLAEAWQEQQQNRIRQQLRDAEAALYRCPGCGAAMLSTGAEENACPICGTALSRSALSRDLEVPTLALPFALSLKEARTALKTWAGKNRLQKESHRVLKALDGLKACYLPCELLRGPVQFRVTRSACARSYHCRGYAEDVLVNGSAQADSLLLSAAEPFDWDAARPFRLELLAEAPAKLPDLPGALLRRRCEEELALHYLGAVERELHCSDLQLQPETTDTLALPVLVPVYLLTVDGTQVIVNGQTGRVAVSREKPVRSHEWLLEPVILSLLAALLWMYVSAGNLELFILATAASIVLIFALLGGERGERLHRRLFRIRDPLRERYEGRFLIDEGSRPAEPSTAVPIRFFEESKGQRVPVEIHYYTARRVTLFLLVCLLLIILPYLLACLLTALRALFGAEVRLGDVEAAYGAVWYVLSAAAIFLGCLSLGRSLLFDHPLLRQLWPDGSTGPLDDNSSTEKLSLWARLRMLMRTDAIVGVAIGVLVVLIGSVAAMLP